VFRTTESITSTKNIAKKSLFITVLERLWSETVQLPMDFTAPIISATDALNILKSGTYLTEMLAF